MTSVLGHVYNLDFPPSCGWGVDPRTLFEAATVRNEASPEQHICQHLGQAAKGCNILILWLDCDREGENIAFEVIENCIPKMSSKHEIFRARFSAITPQDVTKAMSNLGKPNKNESLSVDARREIDLKVGVAFTRYQTTTFHFRYANLDAHLISYGPCQTPTLGFCVDRYDEIQRFRSTPYFKLVAHILRNGIKTKLKWQRNRVMKDRSICVGYQSKMSAAGSSWATVKEAKTSTSKMARPIPLNTVALMKVASTLLGMGPQQCMHIAEHLYINGWISYPRTESSSYPEHFDIYEVIEQHVRHPEWGQVAERMLNTGLQRAKKGVDHGDHPPITPMACAVRDRDLSGSEWRLYEYIACHFIATVCEDAVIENQTILYDIGGESFAATGSALKSPGFLEVMPWHRPADKYMSSSVVVGEKHPVESITIKEGMTKPPGFISESELISLMEKHGIGTDASIPTHIENIQRSYVKLHERTRTLEPNKLGIALVHGYHRIDPELVLPKVRANIESMCAKIATGEATYEEVLKKSLQIFTQKFDNLVASVGRMDELFEASFSSLGQVEVNTRLKPKCGKCARYMKYIDTKPHRLYCMNCEEVYSMPKDGSLKSDGTVPCCPLDGFELVVHTDRRGKTSHLCPKCYNEPEFPGMQTAQNCSQCPNLSCAHNIANWKVEETCPHCEVGFLALEPQNGRRIDCNLCGYHVELPHDASKIIMSKRKCKNCKSNSTMLAFKYSEKNTPHEDKTILEFEACIRCDPLMSPRAIVKIPGVRVPRGVRAPRGKPVAATSGSTGTAPSKPSEAPSASTLARNADLIKRGFTVISNDADHDDGIDYGGGGGPRGRKGRGRQQQPQKAAPISSSASLMDFVVIHKGKKSASAQPSAPVHAEEEEWEKFDPSALQDVHISPPAVSTPQPPAHTQQRDNNRRHQQGQQPNRAPHGGDRNNQRGGNQRQQNSQPKQQQQQGNNHKNNSNKPSAPEKKETRPNQSNPNPNLRPKAQNNETQSSAPNEANRAPNHPKKTSAPREPVKRASTSAAPSNAPKPAEQKEQKQRPPREPKPAAPASAVAAPSSAALPKAAAPKQQHKPQGGAKKGGKATSSQAPQYVPKPAQ